MLKKFIIFSSAVVLTACGLDDKLCDLAKTEQEMLNKANRTFGQNLFVKRIPCEGIYIRVELLNNSVSDSVMNYLHETLYDSITNRGWQTLMVYDHNGKYLFSHSSKGKKYQQSGD